MLQTARGDLDVEPKAINFGPIAEGRVETRNLVVTNPGVLALRVTPVLVEGSSPDYSIPLDPIPLAPRAIGALEITFTPRGAGSDEATLRLTTDDDAVQSVDVQLTGGPIAPRLEVTPNPVDFAPATSSTVTRDITLKNTGDANLLVTGLTIDPAANPAFSVESIVSIVLSPGESRDATLTYRRTGSADNGVLMIGSDSVTGQMQRIQLIPDRLHQCEDGEDNDDDRWVDFPQDPGCESADDDDELDVPECEHGRREACGVGDGECVAGERLCERGRWSPCEGAVGPTPELCDGLDNDCNTRRDEGLSETCDVNGCAGARVCVENSTVTGGQWSACVPITTAPEACDGADNDCNGVVDDGLTEACSIDGCAGVRTCVVGGAGVWTACAPAVVEPPVVLMAPADGGMTSNRTPALSWSTAPGATYALHLSADPSLSPEVAGYPVSPATSPHTVGMPLSPGAWYWQVDARSASGCTSTSTVQSFTVAACNFTFNLQLPADGASLIDPTPDLAWDFAATDTCTLTLTDDGSVAIAGYPLASVTPPHTVATPLPDGTYRWSVQCVDEDGCASDAPAGAPGYRTFDISTACTVGTPSLAHPADGAQWLGGPRLGWQAAAGATTYTVSLDTDPSFSSPAAVTRMTTGTTLHVINDLNINVQVGSTWYWKVTAGNGACTGPESQTRTFTVAMLYDGAACTGVREGPSTAMMGGGLFGVSYASQIDLVESGPLAGKILVAVSDSDGLLTVASTIRCFESNGLTPCTDGPGASFGAQLAVDFNTNVPGVTVDPSGNIYVSASNGLSRNMYVFNSAGGLSNTVMLPSFVRGLLYDDASGAPQILANDNGVTLIRSLSTAGATRWTAGTSGVTNIDVEADRATNRIFQTIDAGRVNVLSYAGPNDPAPSLQFTIGTLSPRFTLIDPVGLTKYVGPPGNRNFIAVSDFASPSSITFFYIGSDPSGADSYPVYRVLDNSAPLRYVIGLEVDPTSGDIFAATHPAGAALMHTSFKLVRYCPRI